MEGDDPACGSSVDPAFELEELDVSFSCGNQARFAVEGEIAHRVRAVVLFALRQPLVDVVAEFTWGSDLAVHKFDFEHGAESLEVRSNRPAL